MLADRVSDYRHAFMYGDEDVSWIKQDVLWVLALPASLQYVCLRITSEPMFERTLGEVVGSLEEAVQTPLGCQTLVHFLSITSVFVTSMFKPLIHLWRLPLTNTSIFGTNDPQRCRLTRADLL